MIMEEDGSISKLNKIQKVFSDYKKKFSVVSISSQPCTFGNDSFITFLR